MRILKIKSAYSLIGVLLMMFKIGISQVSYSIAPASSINFTVAFNQTNEAKIYQVNTGAVKLVLKWEKVSVNLPSGWTYSSCDYGACYGGIPAGPTTMDSIPVGGQGFIGIDIDPGNIAGSGFVKAYVYQEGYYNNGDTLAWNISTDAVGVKELIDEKNFKFYPNPVIDYAVLSFDKSIDINEAWVMDESGKKIKAFKPEELTGKIDLTGIDNGCYQFVIETQRMKFVKRFVKLN